MSACQRCQQKLVDDSSMIVRPGPDDVPTTSRRIRVKFTLINKLTCFLWIFEKIFDETLEPVSTAYVPYRVVCIRTKGVAQGQSTSKMPPAKLSPRVGFQ